MEMYLTSIDRISGILDFISKERQQLFTRFSMLSRKDILHIINLAGGYWRHNGDPKMPHAVLRSGRHSDGFIALPEALKYPAINDLFATLLISKIKAFNPGRINWVVGSDHAAAALSYAAASRLAKDDLHSCVKHDFTEKGMEANEEVQKWSRHVIGQSERVLQIEELCSTFLTLQRVRAGIARFHKKYPITYVPIIGMAVNRTGSEHFEENRIISLVDITFNEWDVNNGEECALCNGGSEPIENVKKSAATWARLNGRLSVV